MAINADTVEGKLNEFGGKAEGAIGAALGDAKTEANGKFDELKGKAQDAFGQAKDVYGKAKDTVQDWADKAPEQVRMAKEKAQAYADDATQKVKTTVQEQPVAVLAGGIALGFVVGWLLSGRKN